MLSKENLKYLPGYIFHAVVLFIIIRSSTSHVAAPPPGLLRSLLSGSNQGFTLPGSEMIPFKQVIPPNVIVTFLTDHPHGQNITEERLFNDARLYMVPVILNAQPVGKAAIVYCSTQEIADQRLQETGYQWAGILAPGKGIAVKK